MSNLSQLLHLMMVKIGVSHKKWRHSLVTDDEVAIRFEHHGRFYSLHIKEVDGL